MPSALRSFCLAAATALTSACALPEATVMPPGLHSPYTGYASVKYADPQSWLCRPDLPADRCRVDLTATEIRPDRSRAVVPHVPAARAKVDCFYVYPTVDLGVIPGNHTDFADLDPMSNTTLAQAARLSEVCDLYVPLYRQVTIGTYLGSEARLEARLGVAFSDVADAFAHYLGQHNRGRKVALIGHSQGAEMVVRLLKRFFDDDPALRERLLVAMPIGGQFEVARGKRVGGSLATIPICAGPDELGCVVAFRTYRAGSNPSTPARWVPKPGNETACVNPASVDRNERSRFSRTYFPATGNARRWLRGVDGVQTPFVVFRDLYAGQCVDGAGGDRYLAVSTSPGPDDARQGPLDLEMFGLNTPMGMHVLDFQFPQGDLIDLVGRRAAAVP
jgi:hypothetical protein